MPLRPARELSPIRLQNVEPESLRVTLADDAPDLFLLKAAVLLDPLPDRVTLEFEITEAEARRLARELARVLASAA